MRRCEVKKNESHLFVSVRGRGVSDQGGKKPANCHEALQPPRCYPNRDTQGGTCRERVGLRTCVYVVLGCV